MILTAGLMSTRHACGPNCGDEPTPPAVEDLRAAVEALADKWEADRLNTAIDKEGAAYLLRALLAEHEPASSTPTNSAPEFEGRPDAPSWLTEDDCERILFHRGHADYLAAVERVVARHRAEAIAQHARQHGCDETPVLRERLAVEFLALEALGRVARAIDEEIARLGQTEPGDPIRAGLIEGYRYASCIVRDQIRGDA
jgi:hypothetical protein